MEYLLVAGHRSDSTLLYVPSTKLLYVKKCERNDKKSYICYQTIINASKNQNGNYIKCTAGVTVDENGVCTPNKIPHSVHDHHEVIYQDLDTLNEVKGKCRYLAANFPGSSNAISENEIFTLEMAK